MRFAARSASATSRGSEWLAACCALSTSSAGSLAGWSRSGDSVCRFPPVGGQGMSVVAQECCVLASLLESRRGRTDPFEGLAEAFFGEIQPLLEAPWAVAMNDLVYSQTRGQRPPDFETRIQYARALMRLAAEDYETDKIVFEVRALLKPQSALLEPELASRVMSMMAVA